MSRQKVKYCGILSAELHEILKIWMLVNYLEIYK